MDKAFIRYYYLMKSYLLKYSHIFALPLLFSTLLYSHEPVTIDLSRDQADFVAQKIWQNEANGELKYLIYWNKNETFLSLGIAHFLWYGKTNRTIYQEMFPLLIDYFAKHNVRLPEWLNSHTPCPWEDRESFMKAKRENSSQYRELYALLVRTMPIQVNFIVERLQNALPIMLESIEDKEEQEQVTTAYYRVLSSSGDKLSTVGIYAILDYVNFKGEGTSQDERYHGEGWGLLQVLEEMDSENKDAPQAFSDAAKKVLSRRIQNAPPERNETQWKKGWFKRVESYSRNQ